MAISLSSVLHRFKNRSFKNRSFKNRSFKNRGCPVILRLSDPIETSTQATMRLELLDDTGNTGSP